MSSADTTPLLDLAWTMARQGRFADAAILFEHLRALSPGDLGVLRGLAAAFAGQGRTLEALQLLITAREGQPEADGLAAAIQAQSLPAIEKFNAYLAAGRVDLAEPYAAALVALAPGNAFLLAAALACNQALDRPTAVARY
ncbi:MAG: hypothetical protein JWP92_1557, partial [Caulobacter sp.]|nr:hypothetical protein [Caulobacter sp.]